jgi:hypothetical protein
MREEIVSRGFEREVYRAKAHVFKVLRKVLGCAWDYMGSFGNNLVIME